MMIIVMIPSWSAPFLSIHSEAEWLWAWIIFRCYKSVYTVNVKGTMRLLHCSFLSTKNSDPFDKEINEPHRGGNLYHHGENWSSSCSYNIHIKIDKYLIIGIIMPSSLTYSLTLHVVTTQVVVAVGRCWWWLWWWRWWQQLIYRKLSIWFVQIATHAHIHCKSQYYGYDYEIMKISMTEIYI